MERRIAIGTLLRPYGWPLAIALLAVVGEGIANLLQPWPLKIVFDIVGGDKPPLHGWLKTFIRLAPSTAFDLDLCVPDST